MQTVKIDANVYNDLRSMLQLTDSVKDRLGSRFEDLFIELQDLMNETNELHTDYLWMEDGTMRSEYVNEDGTVVDLVIEPKS